MKDATKRAFPKWLKSTLLLLLSLFLVGALTVLGVNLYIIGSTENRVLDAAGAKEFAVDCILILGAGVREDGSPSHMLEDRLKTGLALYEAGVAPKIIVSGDHGRVQYNEVGVMKDFLVTAGVPSEDVFMDHAGFSTYESLYRARDVFSVEKVVIVTQEYHLYRAIHIADRLSVEAVGNHADLRPYAGQSLREIREVAARVKDWLYCFFLPEPTYLGEVIPVSGNGNLTAG